MTIQQFSDQFDVLYNNITSNQAPGLNEYEKSVFLTKAQEEIVKNYFSPKANPKGDGFDDSPKRQADFSTLIESITPTIYNGISKFDQRSVAFQYPGDVFLTLNEQLMDGNIPLVVFPISYTEYDRLMAKPYKFPPKYQAWRLITKTAIPSGSEVQQSYQLPSQQYVYINSSYSKPIRLVIACSSSAQSEAPIISESDGMVSIALHMGALDCSTSAAYIDKFGLDTTSSPLYPYIGVINTSGSTGTVIPIFAVSNSVSGDFVHPGNVVGTSVIIAELIGRFNNTPYYRIRYVRRPRAIRLAVFDAAVGPSIGTGTAAQTSELPDHLHEEILQRAVELAKVAWTNNGQDNVSLAIEAGKRSE